MEPTWTQIILLGIIQGVAELLPISSSAHVILFEKIFGLNPADPFMTFLLVILHTGTVSSVLLFFWSRWKNSFFNNRYHRTNNFFLHLFVATVCTLGVGFLLVKIIEKFFISYGKHEIEQLFGYFPLIAFSLWMVGMLIVLAGCFRNKNYHLSFFSSIIIGIVQGIAIPFRGFSRSGATISTGLILGISRTIAEDFSFALVVAITPFVLAKEGLRLYQYHDQLTSSASLLTISGCLGFISSFLSGIIALKWLSSVLEKGRWIFFGYYCIGFALLIFLLFLSGYCT